MGRTFTAAQKAQWAEESKAKVEALTERLAAGVEGFQNTDNFRSWLGTLKLFHQYSWGNTLLIAFAMPTATRCAGYGAWTKVGRQVRKGEKGIGILAPLTYRREDATTGEVVSGVRGYRSVAVFDVSQTDGEPLPDLDVPDLSGDDDGLLDALTALSGALGVTVEQRLLDPNGPKGWFSPGSRSIVVGSNFAALQQAKTLAHELGHALDPGLDADHNPTTREAVAEGVAYVVATSYGLTVDDYSFGYIASWAGSGDGRKVLQGVLGRIQKAAHRVFEAMGATGQDELDEAA